MSEQIFPLVGRNRDEHRSSEFKRVKISFSALHADVPADSAGTTNMFSIGPTDVGRDSAKLRILNSLSCAMLRKFSFRSRKVGESATTI